MKKFGSWDSNILVSVIILLFTTGYMVTGYLTLDGMSRQLPMLTAYVTIFLLILNILKDRLPNFIAKRRERAEENDDDDEMADVSVAREFKGIAYITIFFLTIYVFGFYIAVPLYLIASIAYLGHQSMKVAILATLPTLLAIYLMFELILEYPLFQGVLFS